MKTLQEITLKFSGLELAVAAKDLTLSSVQNRKFHIDVSVEDVIRLEIREHLNEL